jgi:hypothetical protein
VNNVENECQYNIWGWIPHCDLKQSVYYIVWITEENNQKLKINQWIVTALTFIYNFATSHLVLGARGERYGALKVLVIVYLSHLLSTRKTCHSNCIIHIFYPLAVFHISFTVVQIVSFTASIHWKCMPFILQLSHLSIGKTYHS